MLDLHVAVRVEINLSRYESAARVMADSDEQAGRVEDAVLAGDGVAEAEPAELVLSVGFDDLSVPPHRDLRVRECAVLHDLGGPKLVAAVDEGDRVREPGQEHGFFNGGVSAASDSDVLVAEERPVAHSAPRDPVAGKSLFAVDAEFAVGGAHCEDDRVCLVDGATAGGDGLDVTGEVEGGGVVVDEAGPELLGLLAQLVHQVRALDAVDETGEVLDLGGVDQGAADLDGAGQHDRCETRAGQVVGGGVSGGAGADDDDVLDAHAGAASRLVRSARTCSVMVSRICRTWSMGRSAGSVSSQSW
ncbi:sugar ABC transporter ATPase (plasmid) [Leifsonia sp. P73]